MVVDAVHRALFAVVALVVATGCQPHDLDWDVRFGAGVSTTDARRLQARIRRGPCPGMEVLYDATIFPGTAETPPELDEGTYCFSALAGDAACQWYASGETTAMLPLDADRITIELRSQAPMANCTTACTDGMCGGPPPTATCSGLMTCNDGCAAGACQRTCTDTSRCNHDCEGGACTDRCSDFSSCDFPCAGGDCNVVCDGAASCTVGCGTGNCRMECRSAANCDFSCGGGDCTFVCSSVGRCDTTCTGGGCSGP